MRVLLQATASVRSVLDASVASHPGAAVLPGQRQQPRLFKAPLSVCSGCKQPAIQLRRCSDCLVAAYCSVACQRE